VTIPGGIGRRAQVENRWHAGTTGYRRLLPDDPAERGLPGYVALFLVNAVAVVRGGARPEPVRG
jgi:hypothetical protein